MPKKKTKEPQEAIIVLGGSFCPPHAGHVAALNRGRAAAERDGLTVVAGYFAVATNGHVRSKLRARGEEPSLIFDAEDRVRMCNAVAETTGWMKPTPGPFGSAQACGAAMVAQHHTPRTRVIKVRGRDVELLTTRDGEAVSSTLVRREMRGGGVHGIGRLLKSGTLLKPVAQIMERLLMNAPGADAPPSDAAAASSTDTTNGFGNLCIGNLSKRRTGPPEGFVDARVDRATACGNPFPMGADGHDESLRDAVCIACDDLLVDPLSADVNAIARRHGLRVDSRFSSANACTELEAELQRLEARLRAGESLRLMCWCVPKRCHAMGIARCLNRRLGRDEDDFLVQNADGTLPVHEQAPVVAPPPRKKQRSWGATSLSEALPDVS